MALLVAPGVANAASELDQKQEGRESAGIVRSGSSFAQTFTAGKSGTLEKVELDLSQFGVGGTPTEPLTVEITEVTASGEPDTTKVLGSASFGPATLPNYQGGLGKWVSFAVTAPSKAGTRYAIVAFSSTPSGHQYDWYEARTNPYAAGKNWENGATPPAGGWSAVFPEYDMTFRTYVAVPPPPTVTKVTASSGPANGGKSVTITGTHFQSVQAVKFGSVAAGKYEINEAGTAISIFSPAQEVAGTVDVTVTTADGTSKITTKDHYKYLPVITGVFPNTGSTAGVSTFGAESIEGYGFAEGFPSSDVFSFGGTIETGEHVSCFAHTGCETFVPAHAAGTVNVTVTVNGATSLKTKADRYTYK